MEYWIIRVGLELIGVLLWSIGVALGIIRVTLTTTPMAFQEYCDGKGYFAR